MARRNLSPAECAEYIDARLPDFLALTAELRAAQKAYQEAVARLPWWAQPGPAMLLADGSLSGSITWAPAIQDFSVPVGSVRHMIRPNEYDLAEHMRPLADVPSVRRTYEARMAALAEREALQKIERDRAGVTQIQHQATALRRRWYVARKDILHLNPSPSRLAFKLLAEIMAGAHGDLPFWQQAYGPSLGFGGKLQDNGRTLRDIASTLPPLLRATVERATKGGAGPMRRWRYWLGPELPYTGGGHPPAHMLQPAEPERWREAAE